jgi:hypothetical protein
LEAPTFAVLELELAQILDKIVVKVTPDLTDGLDFLASPGLARRDQRLAFVNSDRDIENGGIGELFAPLDREIALFDIYTLQTRCSIVRDQTEEDATGSFNGFAEFGFPIIAWLELLFVKPDKEAFFLKLFDYVFRDREIRRRVTDEDTSRCTMSEAMGLFHKSDVVGALRVSSTPALCQFGYEFTRT